MKNIRHRYIAFELSRPLGAHHTRSSLIQAMTGRLRLSMDQPAGLRFHLIQYDPETSRGIAKIVPHTATEWMKNFIRSIDEIYGQRVTTHILGASGTLKTIRRKFLRT